MSAWRVTYLPESTTDARPVVTVTVEDAESPSLEAFVSRLSGGALGLEWTNGRVICSVEAFGRHDGWHRRYFVTALIVGVVVGLVFTGVVFLGFNSNSPGPARPTQVPHAERAASVNLSPKASPTARTCLVHGSPRSQWSSSSIRPTAAFAQAEPRVATALMGPVQSPRSLPVRSVLRQSGEWWLLPSAHRTRRT